MTHRNWPKEHRALLAALMIMITAAMVVYVFVIRPEAVVVADIRGERDSLLKELTELTKKTPYPLDANRLQTMVEAAKSKLNGVKRKREDGTEYNTGLIARSSQVLEHATSMFDERIKREYTDVNTFMNQASRIGYRDELDELTHNLEGKQIILDKEVLGIGEDTDDEETYQLLLKVWTIDRLVNVLVEKGGLFIERRRLENKGGAEVPRGPFGLGGGGRFASEITALPTRYYILHKDDKAPYVLEFPIRVRVQGPLPTVCNAIRDLQADGNFLTVNRIVLETENPLNMAQRQPGSDGFVRTRNVVVMLEISSYFRPSGHAPTIQRSEVKTLPPGA